MEGWTQMYVVYLDLNSCSGGGEGDMWLLKLGHQATQLALAKTSGYGEPALMPHGQSSNTPS